MPQTEIPRCGYSRINNSKEIAKLSRGFYGLCRLRSNGFDLHRLGWNTDGNGVGRYVLSGDAHGAEQAMFVYPDAAHHRGVIGNARLGADLGARVDNDHAVIQVVRARLDAGVIRDSTPCVDH